MIISEENELTITESDMGTISDWDRVLHSRPHLVLTWLPNWWVMKALSPWSKTEVNKIPTLGARNSKLRMLEGFWWREFYQVPRRSLSIIVSTRYRRENLNMIICLCLNNAYTDKAGGKLQSNLAMKCNEKWTFADRDLEALSITALVLTQPWPTLRYLLATAHSILNFRLYDRNLPQ